MRYDVPPGVLLGLSLTKSALIGLALALALGLGATVTDRADQSAAPSTEVSDSRVNRLMDRYQCSETGFGSDVIPNSSLIHLDGRVKRVSFDRGWAVFTGDEPGTLMAVCRL
ncbi:MAG TPA: hypothetical protein VFO49_05275 [Nocardioides sp.]|nr:hypothetical protein [Nocardioides sp.]